MPIFQVIVETRLLVAAESLEKARSTALRHQADDGVETWVHTWFEHKTIDEVPKDWRDSEAFTDEPSYVGRTIRQILDERDESHLKAPPGTPIQSSGGK